MKKIILFLTLVFMFGCSYEGKQLGSYLEDPGSIIKDPHFEEYQSKRDDLESQYLRKEITYAEYLEKLNELEEMYSKEVQERQQVISY